MMIFLFALFMCLGCFGMLGTIIAYVTAQVLSDIVLGSTKREVERVTLFTGIVSIFFLVLANIVATIM